MLLRTFTLLKRQLPAMLLLLLCCQVAVAQSLSIQGKVTDEQGSGLPGASVAVKRTTNGTITDGNGNYKLSVRNQDDILVVSFIGYLAQELPVGSKGFINFQLQPNQNQLNEVVVTALGIEREEKALGYATQTVSGESLTNARSNNFASALSGKVAGLTLVSPGSGPVNSTRISLRGDNSLDPNGNNALIILDGVPLNSGMTSSGVDNAYGAGSGNDIPVDFGNGIADINPDDIESMTVLRGSNAATLYGSQGANGVVLITTKKGRQGAAKVEFNTGVTLETVLKKPELQFKYGSKSGTEKESWSTTPGNYASNYVDDWFQTGTNVINSLAVSGGTDKRTVYFSYGTVTATGITPTNTYNRNNFTFKQSTKL